MTDHILFEACPGIRLALAPDSPKFTVIAASQDFIHIFALHRDAIIGKSIFELPYPNEVDPFRTHKQSLSASFQYVIDHQQSHQLPIERSYVPQPGESSSEKYVQARNVPVLDPLGNLLYIIHTWENVTASVTNELNQVRFKGINDAYDLLMQAPIVIGMVKGKDHILQMANGEAFKLWGRGSEIIGKPLLESLPELKGQKVIELFDQVLNTGVTYTQKALPVKAIINGEEQFHYFDVVYQPVFEDGQDQASGVFTMSHDVTAQINAQKSISKSEERFHVALEAAHMGTWDVDILNNTIVVSDEVKKIFGVPLDTEYTYDFFVGNIIEEDRAYALQANRDVMTLKNGLSEYDIQFRIRRLDDGKLRWIRSKGEVHVNSEGKPYRFTGVLLDITPQKEAQERFYYIFESVPVTILEKDYSDMVVVLDELKQKHGDRLKTWLEENMAEVYRLMFLIKIVDINKASLKMFDADRKEQLLKGLAVVFTEEAVPAFIGELMAIANREQTYEAEYMLQTLKGRRIPCLTTMSFPSAKYDSVLVSRYDISDFKKAEQALRESEERFRTMANSIPQLAWMTDKTGSRYWYNERWYEYTGTNPEEMEGWGWKKVQHPDMVEGVEKRYRAAIEAGREWEDIFLLRGKNGEYRWFLSRAVPVRDGNNVIVGWFGTNTDITDQRKTEHALKKSEELLVLAMEGGDLGVYDYYPLTGEMVWSKRAKEMFGLSQDATVDYDTFLSALHPEDRERAHHDAQMALLHESGGRYESEFRVIANGKINWLRAKGKTFFDERGKAWRITGVNMDVTRQKEAEEALRQSEQQFRTLVENLPQLVSVTDADGVVEFACQRWKEYLGNRPAKTESLQQIMQPEDWRSFMSLWNESRKTGKSISTECRLKNKKGSYRWFALHAEAIRNESGKIEKWIAAYTDIHDQKTFAKQLEKLVAERTKELKKSNDELQRFVHVSSHDFKEPIRKIMLFTGRLDHDLKGAQNEMVKVSVKTIRTSALRLLAILEGVRTYSAVNMVKATFKKVNLNEVIKKVESDLEMVIEHKKAVINYANLPKLRGVPDLLHLVFYNLISNSLKFAKAGEPPVINITCETVEEKGRKMSHILLLDNGIGFKQEYAEKIFSSFTRLESLETYEGAGLGLSLCRKIIEQHGGSITAEGKENIGATFHISLPLDT